jgi:hypothetical protein
MRTDWTMWGSAVQTVAGFLGGQAAASAAHEHRFGFLGHSLAGLVGGALSGIFLQPAVFTIVTGSGSQNASTTVEIAVLHALNRRGRRRDPDVRSRIRSRAHDEAQTTNRGRLPT